MTQHGGHVWLRNTSARRHRTRASPTHARFPFHSASNPPLPRNDWRVTRTLTIVAHCARVGGWTSCAGVPALAGECVLLNTSGHDSRRLPATNTNDLGRLAKSAWKVAPQMLLGSIGMSFPVTNQQQTLWSKTFLLLHRIRIHLSFLRFL